MKKLKNKNKYLSCIQKQSYKIAVVLVVISMFASFLNINQTFAYFSDEATSTGNTFTAGTLEISTSSDLGPVSLGVVKNYSVINQGSLPFEYEMTALISGGSDTTFCGQLNIVISKGADILYTGGLSGLDFTKLIGGTQDNLTFTITDSHANPAGKVCSFNLISKAWQDELDYSQGFTDIAYTKAVVYSAGTTIPSLSSGVVLNEFLPNPNGSDYGFDFGDNYSDMPQGEWIELYNNSNASIDLTGWYIKDLADNKINITAINTQPATTIILAHKWLVVYMNTSILNNTEPETITLYNSLNVSQNSYSYDGGTYCDMQPTHGDDNDTNPSGPCTSVPPNKSFARIPDGIGAWVDPIPTPGMPNELGDVIVQEETIIPEEVVVPEELIEPEELLPSASLPEEIPPATEEEVVTEVSETVEAPVSEVVEPEIIQTAESIVTELTPAISETEPILEPVPVVEVPAVLPATVEPAPSE